MSVDNLVGQTLGAYELHALLGAGGMGAVYRAVQTTLRREVALKVLPLELARQPGYVDRFTREAKVAAALEHPHIVPIYDYGTQRDISYVVMRLLTGGSLSDRIQQAQENGKLPSLGEISNLLRQLASALEYAHSRGVIHRDIKPSNVMFDSHGNAYLVDFGIAKLLGATNALTGTGQALGTPSYMPPEQWRDDPITPAADQYALAVLVYSLLTGRLPFEATTLYALMHKHLTEAPTPPETYRVDIPTAVSEVLERALSKTPEDRFTTITDFSRAFDAAAATNLGAATGFFTVLPQMPIVEGQTPPPGTPPPQWRSAGAATPAPQPDRGEASTLVPPVEPRKGRSPIVWVVALLVLAIVAGGVYFVFLAPRPPQVDSGATGTAVALAALSADATDTPAPEPVTEATGQAEQTQTAVPVNVVLVEATATTEPGDTEAPAETVTPSATPLDTDVPTATETEAPAVTPTEAPTATATLTETPAETPSETGTPSKTPTDAPTVVAFVATDTDVPATATATVTVTDTEAPTETATDTPTDTEAPPAATPTATVTDTKPPSDTPTSTPTPTATRTPTSSATPSPVPSDTPTATETPTDTQTPSDTPSREPTDTRTPTATDTPTDTPTDTATLIETPTHTFTPGETPLPSETPTPVPTDTPVATPPPTATAPAGPATAVSLQFDTPTGVDGWIGPVPLDEEGQSVVWMARPLATLPVWLQQGQDYNVKFRVVGAAAQEFLDTLTLTANGVLVPMTYREDRDGARVYDATIPASLVGDTPVALTFKTRGSVTEIIPVAGETLPRLVAFDWLRIAAQPAIDTTVEAAATVTPAQVTAGKIEYGQTVSGELTAGGEQRWRFEGRLNDWALITLSSLEVEAELSLLGPSGRMIVSYNNQEAVSNPFMDAVLPADGAYTLVVRAVDETQSGAYQVHLMLAPRRSLLYASPDEVMQRVVNEGLIEGLSGFLAAEIPAYVIDQTGLDDTLTHIHFEGQYGDFVMGGTLAFGPGAPDDTCGFVFREVDEQNYYVVEIDQNGLLTFVEQFGGEWQPVQQVELQNVKIGEDVTNELVLVAIDNRFYASVNHGQFELFQDDTLTSGRVSIETTTFAGSDESRCVFRDAWVWDLDG